MPKEPVPAFELDPLRLNDAFCRIAAELAEITDRYARSLGKHLRAEAARKRIMAELFLDLKSAPLDSGKVPSDEVVKQMVLRDPRFVDAMDYEIDCEVHKVRMWGLTEALKTKRDALVSLGAHLRAELQGDPMIRRRDDEDDA